MIEAKQSPVPQKIKTEGQHYSSPLSSVHGPAPEKPKIRYDCPDCQDLYERLRKALGEMGHEL